MTLTRESEAFRSDLLRGRLSREAHETWETAYTRRLAAIEAAVRAEQAAEVERLREVIDKAMDLIVYEKSGYAFDVLRAALAATPVAPAPNSAPNPPAPHRCRECDDGPNLSFPEPTHAPPAPGELTNLIRQQQASGGGPVTAVMVSRSGDEPDPTTLLEPAP